MRYVADIVHHFAVLVLFAAIGGIGFSTALQVPAWKATLARPAAIATPPPKPALPAATRGAPEDDEMRALAARRLLVPVRGVEVRAIRDSYHERRGARRHEALDIMAPHGTPVLAADDGRIGKLSRTLAGGISIHQVDREGRFVYYYAHLAGYAEGLREGMEVRRGDVIGFVGSTGNASAKAPHLHFAVLRTAPGKRWWKGAPLNPHPLLTGAA